MGTTRVELRSVGVIAAFLALGVPQVVPAQPDLDEVREQVFLVRGFDSMGLALGDISGFAAGGGFLVTNAELLRGAESVVVVTPGATDEFEVTVIAADRRSDVAILQAERLDAVGVSFAAAGGEPEAGDGVHLPGFAENGSVDDAPSPGSISDLRVLEPAAVGERSVLLFQHNAPATARQYGMPVLNACGEVIGMLRTDPVMSQTALNARPAPGTSPYAVAAQEVLRALGEAGAEPTVSDEPCLDLRARAEFAEAAAAEAERRRAEVEADAAATREERDAAQRAAAESEAAAEAAREQAEAAAAAREQAEAQAAAERAAAEVRQRRLLVVIVLSVAAAVAVVLVLIRRLRRRRAQLAAAEEAVEAAIQPAAFSCLLEGADDSGRAHVLKITAEQLGTSGGVVIGRNPAQAGALLDHPEASREHFRLTVEDDRLMIADLHSTNGTFVDGERLRPGEARPLHDSGVIGVGSAISLSVSVNRVSS